jgi:hypothetical protein
VEKCRTRSKRTKRTMLSSALQIGALVLGSGGLLTGLIALLTLRSKTSNVDSQTGLNKAQETEVIQRASQINEQRERDRDREWERKIELVKQECNGKISELEEEVNILEIFIDSSVPWIWGAVRELRINGISYADAPSLPNIRREYRASRQRQGDQK